MVAVTAVSVFGDPSGIWGPLEPVFGYRSPPERVDGKAILCGDIKGVKQISSYPGWATVCRWSGKGMTTTIARATTVIIPT